MKLKNLLFLTVSLLLVSKLYSDGDSVSVFTNNHVSKLIGSKAYIFQDKTNKIDFNTLQDKESDFVLSKIEVPNLGVSPYTYWLKFSIKNLSNEENLLMEISQPFINELILYSPIENNKYEVQIIGDSYPFYFREFKYPNFVLNIKIKPGATKKFFLKLKGDEQILAPLKLGTRSTIISELHNIDLIFGVYTGIILAMLFYNLFIYFSVRDRIYLRYVVYIFFIGFTQASILGYPFEYLWPQQPWIAQLSIYLFSCGVGITALEFLKPFLNTKQLVPKLHAVSYFITGLYTLTAVLSLFGFMTVSYLLVQLAAAIVAIYMLIVALIISRRGYKPASFFLVAWSTMLVGIVIFILKDFGFLPTNGFTSYTMPIGSALETILLSFALADRINILKKEKEESQAEALEISQQNQKLITEQNIVLEQKVHERTNELEMANEELTATLNQLKDAQIQLVDAEKMASLGQLTAGIAHEINNPINFVIANINPLRMDVSELLELIKKYDMLRPGEPGIEVHKEIEDYKQKIDLAYMKIEIDKILAGIDDGARRTAEIVAGLKNFSRLDESDVKVASINDGIESTLILLRSTVPSDVQIVKNLAVVPLIECYPGKLNQVFMNLFTNALYALNKRTDSVEKKLMISTFERDEKLIVVIEDTGVGMTKEVKDKVFEPFFTTKDVGEGTGLGMSIVFKIIETHQAKIEIESTPDIGTKITLQLNKKIMK